MIDKIENFARDLETTKKNPDSRTENYHHHHHNKNI